MITNQCTVPVFEIDGKSPSKDQKKISFQSHPDRPEYSVIMIDSEAFTVMAKDLKAAVKNIQNLGSL